MVTKEEIKEALIQAEQAHRLFEKIELKGIYDENWPVWYTAFVLGRLPELKDPLKVYHLIKEAAREHETHPKIPWASFYSEYLVQKLII
jgi:hypothetical protein